MEKHKKELVVFIVAIVALGGLLVMTLGKGKQSQGRQQGRKPAVQVAQRTGGDDPDSNRDPEAAAADKGPIVPYQGNIVGHPRERDPFVAALYLGNVPQGGDGQSDTGDDGNPAPSGTTVPPVPRGGRGIPPPVPPIPWGMSGPIRPVDPR